MHLFPLNRTAENLVFLRTATKQKKCPDVRAKVET